QRVAAALPRTGEALADILAGARIVVVCGSGGVGKTTISAALAVGFAERRRRTALLTVEPARRLATALHPPMAPGGPTGRRPGRLTMGVARFGAAAFARTVGRLVGAEVLSDTVEFLSAFEGMYGGFKERAARVLELLKSDECEFVIVMAPNRASLEEAGYFV